MTPREIYLDALRKIDPVWGVPEVYESDYELAQCLRKYSDGVRQTREARIARKALKDATYARMFGVK